MSLHFPYNFNYQSTLAASELQEQFDVISTKFNGGITDDDVSTNANISASKLGTISLTSYYEIVLRVGSISGGWADGSSTNIALVTAALPEGEVTVESANWACSDVGAGARTAKLSWGHWDSGTGAWTEDTAVGSAFTMSAIASTRGAGAITIASAVALGSGANTRMLAVVNNSTADATCLDAAGDFLTVTVKLSRTITT